MTDRRSRRDTRAAVLALTRAVDRLVHVQQLLRMDIQSLRITTGRLYGRIEAIPTVHPPRPTEAELERQIADLVGL